MCDITLTDEPALLTGMQNIKQLCVPEYSTVEMEVNSK